MTISHDKSDEAHSGRLNKWQAAALLTADCVGVGILALSQDVHVLGAFIGLGFLLINLPVNYYAGSILAYAATHVESSHLHRMGSLEMVAQEDSDGENELHEGTSMGENRPHVKETVSDSQHKNRQSLTTRRELASHAYESTSTDDIDNAQDERQSIEGEHDVSVSDTSRVEATTADGLFIDGSVSATKHPDGVEEEEADSSEEAPQSTAAADFIVISSHLFRGTPAWTRMVLAIYYLNIFLVLGDYLLVMSHAVTAMVGEDEICLPTAGILATMLMFAVSQMNTMAVLGREASILSLLALLVVLLQCLWALRENKEGIKRSSEMDDGSVLRKFSALASIGFAVGSQKLFLNIRNEMALKAEASQTLAISLTSFGVAYLVVVSLAGPDPPAFLFDAIPRGFNRRIAGFLLWGHVAVSYAINSQALCSSLDRMFFHSVRSWSLNNQPRRRWLILTFLMAFLSYVVSNAIPFFKDLVSLIGALTSVPLSLTLPALLYRKACSLTSLFCPSSPRSSSFWLLVYSLLFLCVGLVGSLSSIEKDWRLHGRPFSC